VLSAVGGELFINNLLGDKLLLLTEENKSTDGATNQSSDNCCGWSILMTEETKLSETFTVEISVWQLLQCVPQQLWAFPKTDEEIKWSPQ